MKRLILWLLKRRHQPIDSSPQLNTTKLRNYLQEAEQTGFWRGHTAGYEAGLAEGSDKGFVDGYNVGRVDAIEEAKQAALKALTKGE